jgi:hypothetical protein
MSTPSVSSLCRHHLAWYAAFDHLGYFIFVRHFMHKAAFCTHGNDLHDIGRFERYAHHRIFIKAKSLNHAELGVQVLTSAKLLERFTRPVRGRILDAVRFYNGAAIPDGLSKEGSRLARMVRDADNLDRLPEAFARLDSQVRRGSKSSVSMIARPSSLKPRRSPAQTGSSCGPKR